MGNKKYLFFLKLELEMAWYLGVNTLEIFKDWIFLIKYVEKKGSVKFNPLL